MGLYYTRQVIVGGLGAACRVRCGGYQLSLTRAPGPWRRQASPLRWVVGGSPGGSASSWGPSAIYPGGWQGSTLVACEEHEEKHGKRRPLAHPVQGSHRVLPMDKEVWARQSGAVGPGAHWKADEVLTKGNDCCAASGNCRDGEREPRVPGPSLPLGSEARVQIFFV